MKRQRNSNSPSRLLPRISVALNFFTPAVLLNTVGIVIARVIKEYSVGATTAASLEVTKDIATASSSLILGSYVPRLGYWRVMFSALLSYFVVCFLMASVGGFGVAMVFYVIGGLVFSMIKISVYSSVGNLTKTPAEHTSLMNRIEAVFQLGSMLGPVIFAVMMQIESFVWTDTYWFFSGLCALSLGVMLFVSKDSFDSERPPPHVDQSHLSKAGFTTTLRLLKRPLIWAFGLCGLFYAMIEQSINTWMPRFDEHIFRLSPSAASVFTGIYFGSIALSRVLSGVILMALEGRGEKDQEDGLPERKSSDGWFLLLELCLLGAFLSILLVVLLSSSVDSQVETHARNWYDAPPLAFVFVAVGFFLGPIYPTLTSVLLSRLPNSLHSSTTSLIIIFGAVGGSSGSVIVGRLSDLLSGIHGAFYFLLVPIVALAALLVPYRWISSRTGTAD